MTPIRIQLSRKKGWRMPPNTVKVDRTTRFGNPFRVGEQYDTVAAGKQTCKSVDDAVRLFRSVANCNVAEIQRDLRGKNLACWCALDQPCHSDVLLELANKS